MLPSRERIDRAVLLVAETLGERYCWLYRGAYHFRLGGDVTVAISADSVQRFRLDFCHGAEPRDTVWIRDGDDARLARVVLELAEAARITV
jgi:hypothetical protein